MPVMVFASESTSVSQSDLENSFHNLRKESPMFNEIVNELAKSQGGKGSNVFIEIVNDIPGSNGARTTTGSDTDYIWIQIEEDAFDGDEYEDIDGNRKDMTLERYLAEEVAHAYQMSKGTGQTAAQEEVSAQMVANYIMDEAYKETDAKVPDEKVILVDPNTYAGGGDQPHIHNNSPHGLQPISFVPDPTNLPPWLKDLFDDWDDAMEVASPLVFDLDGDGIELASVLSDGAVYWDIDKDGFAEASAWVTGGDGLLTIDLNGDGRINDHGELFGTKTTDGFSVLSAYDTNSDGVIDATDAQWNDLLVWVDVNANGYSESDELFSLDILGITEIDLNASLVDYEVEGNQVTHESTFTINGQEQTIVDAWFAYDNTNSEYAQDYTLDLQALLMPNLRGYGDVADLHIAMSLDETLLNMVNDIVSESANNLLDPTYDLKGKIEEIMYKWADVDDLDPDSRGGYFDARKLTFLEKYIGEDFLQSGHNPYPNVNAASLLEQAFSKVVGEVTTAFLLRSEVQFFNDDASYDAFTGQFDQAAPYQLDFVDTNGDVHGGTYIDEAFIIDSAVTDLTISNRGGQDTIWWRGVNSEDVTYERDGRDLVIHNGTKTITIANQFFADGYGPEADAEIHRYEIEELAFENGIVVDLTTDLTFTGTEHAEYLSGDYDNNILYGLGGNDNLNGDKGNDVLIGGAGDDALYGGEGDDTFEWSIGDGSDKIFETYSGNDQIILHDLNKEDVSFERDGRDLIIHVGDETLTIDNQYYAYGYAPGTDTTSHRYEVETLVFEDGEALDLSTVLENEAVVTQNDGFSANQDEIITGNLLTNDSDPEGDSFTIVSGTYLTEHGVIEILQDGSFSYSPDQDYVGKDSYTYFVEDARGIRSSAQVTFTLISSDTTIVNTVGTEVNEHLYSDQDETTTDALYGLGGSDTLHGSSGHDILIGGTGNDSLYGGAGDDTYEWSVGDGDDYITEGGGADSLLIHNVTLDDIGFEKYNNSDLRIKVGSETIQVSNQFYSDTNNDSAYDYYLVENIVLDDGAIIDLTGGLSFTGSDVNEHLKGTYQYADILEGLDGSDTLYGYGGDDILIGGVGSDSFYGGTGNDTYEWSVGDGNDFITEEGGSEALLLHNVTLADVRLARYSTYDLNINIGSEVIQVRNQFNSDQTGDSSYDYYQVENIVLDDGTTIDLTGGLSFTGDSANNHVKGTNLYSDILNGLDGSDTLYGYGGDDILIGGVGSDSFYGGTGNDTYEWSVGDGNDYITEEGGSEALLLHNVTLADVRLARYSTYDLNINIGSEVIQVRNQFNSDQTEDSSYDYYQVENILLDDGTTIDLTSGLTFTGINANDNLHGLNGADTLIGLEGNDSLYGHSGQDILIGGVGNDSLLGGTGNDTYEWSVGDGNDYISEEGGVDYLVLHNVESTDVNYVRSGNNLKIEINGEEIQVGNFFSGSDYKLDNVVFDDGTIVDLPLMFNEAPVATDDAFIGDQDVDITGNVFDNNGSGVDSDDGTFSAVAGTYATNNGSVVISEDGSFVYTPDTSYNGIDSFTYTITDEYGVTDTATVSLTVRPPNVAPVAADDAFIGNQDQNITGNVLSDNGNGADSDPDGGTLGVVAGTYATTHGSVTISSNGSFTYTPEAGYFGADSFTYTLEDDRGGSDMGTANITLTEVVPGTNNIYGTAAADTLNGDVSEVCDDTLIGFGGNDTLNGKLGNDAYEWSVGDGNDTINETGGVDQLVLHGVTEDQIRFEKYGNYDLRVHVDNEYIEINYQMFSDYQQNHTYDTYQVESILLDDGTTIDLTGSLTFTGTSGADTLTALNLYDTTLEGLAGNDTLNGKTQNDTYIWSVGDGNDQINETGGIDQLVLHGVTEDQIRFEKYGNYDLRIHVDNEYIEINYQLFSDYQQNTSYDTYQVESIMLDDGTVIDLTSGLPFTGTANGDSITATHMNDELYGLAGNDTLTANGGDDLIEGGLGNDTLHGNLGNDSYVWSVGDGNDTIDETGGVDQLVLHGVTEDQIRFEKYGNYDLRVHVDNEYIEINYQMFSDYQQNHTYDTYQVESILLDDGSTIDLTGSMTFTGTSGADTLTALNLYDTTLEGLAGNDTLNGKTHSESYVWSVGDGNDTINETGGVDQLVLHGVMTDDIRLEKYGNYDLRVNVDNEYIEINYQLFSDYQQNTSYDTYQVESILLDDGSTIDLTSNYTFTGTSGNDSMYATNQDDVLYGLDGSDYLYGGNGDDLLYGGGGVDMLYGQGGADTFAFEADSAFTNSDNIQDFNLSEGDALDISNILSGYDPLTDAITDFVQITESGSNSYLNVDADGGADNFVQIAYLYNVTGLTDEEALETNGDLITV